MTSLSIMSAFQHSNVPNQIISNSKYPPYIHTFLQSFPNPLLKVNTTYPNPHSHNTQTLKRKVSKLAKCQPTTPNLHKSKLPPSLRNHQPPLSKMPPQLYYIDGSLHLQVMKGTVTLQGQEYIMARSKFT
jgi:hypothetical protein